MAGGFDPDPDPLVGSDPLPLPIHRLCTNCDGIAFISEREGTGFIYAHVVTSKSQENGIRCASQRRPLVVVWDTIPAPEYPYEFASNVKSHFPSSVIPARIIFDIFEALLPEPELEE
jgi:hypothetical protein